MPRVFHPRVRVAQPGADRLVRRVAGDEVEHGLRENRADLPDVAALYGDLVFEAVFAHRFPRLPQRVRVELDAGDLPRGVARVPQQRDRPAAGAEVRAALPLFRRGEMREQNRVGREAVRAAHQHAAVRRERLPVFVFPHGVPSCMQNVVAGGKAAPPV